MRDLPDTRRVHAISMMGFVLIAALSLGAQQPRPPGGGAGPSPPAPAGAQGRGGGFRNAYPDRPPADPLVLERGKGLYGVHCAFCHGADTRGGDGGGPSLLRSQAVLDDQQGERIAPIVKGALADRGMPKLDLAEEQIRDVAAYIHSFKVAGYDESRQRPPSIVVGDAKAGEAYFNRTCASCHSATGDLRGIGSRIADPRQLQQTWLMPGSGGGRGGPGAARTPRSSVTVTLPSGRKVEGVLDRLDDFVVSLTTADGDHVSFRTTGGVPKVEVRDPLQPHKDLLRVYADADIHNVTAFLVTLK